ncbi:hypothetical protein [Endozoicomonas sp. 8E]|uniref:hypothetical protein n=1 Tax=Endozoicomonas sp. 8E TaxID=3035692 RepID=UPI0029390721|nr:hypothetical protein [Endozoicomonas sp. 8E]WOG28497.1 hypothetical protein P6910_02240 [Endozoicomonas sp. 8E]
MKKTLSSSLLLLLMSVTVICQAESLKRHFIVEFQQNEGVPKGSFSIKRDINSLSCNPSCLADINYDAESIFPPDDKQPSVGIYGATKSLIESISWELIYATHLLVAYKLVLTTSDNPMSTKANSWIPVEAFAAVGLLLKSYWSPELLLFNPMDHREATSMMTEGGDPFVITTMMLPGNGQQQSQPNNKQAKSSGQQASGATNTRISGSITGSLTSGSGGSGESPEQQHTFDLNCHVDSCHGVCILRSSSDSKESAAGSPNSEEIRTGRRAAKAGRTTTSNLLPDAIPDRFFSNHLPGLNDPLPEPVVVFETLISLREVDGISQPIYHPHIRHVGERAAYRPRSLDCDELVDEGDGERIPCGKIFRNARKLARHKKRRH